MTITDDDGERWEFTHTYIGQGDKIIAQVQHQSKDSGWPHVHNVEEMWANARLIAAAPELLAAAVQLRDFLQTLAGEVQIPSSLYLQGKRAMDAAELAFSKAKGGAA